MLFTADAKKELDTMFSSVSEILTLAYEAFVSDSPDAARCIEPLEQVIDGLKSTLRDSHIRRLKNGECSIEAGFVWIDLLTNLERTADHCSNIAVCIIDASENNMNIHESLRSLKKNNPDFEKLYSSYAEKYSI
ncbi:MAG: PhoU domain-containing protein [Clostridia bacterium]|nr:PhoU domain-containing protein [Clostridia bacterium]